MAISGIHESPVKLTMIPTILVEFSQLCERSASEFLNLETSRFKKILIESVYNVSPDGNCGFRAVARHVKNDENRWKETFPTSHITALCSAHCKNTTNTLQRTVRPPQKSFSVTNTLTSDFALQLEKHIET
ncbi:hypothetical protein BDB01DRAFT_832988 [Pilobolus umbonatus]|nr:hypothetical protein BDB01DRAFT_832988 [Pilobolus umbonatus]